MGVGTLTKICSHSEMRQKAAADKGRQKREKGFLGGFYCARCHPARKFIYFKSDRKCSGALGVIVEEHMCVDIGEGVSV